MKNFYLKILVAIFSVLAIYISIDAYSVYTQTKNFQILNERQSIIIQLPNTEYIEIIARNDNIANAIDFYERPFTTNTKIQKNSNLESSVANTNINTEYIENGEGVNRLLRILHRSNRLLTLELYSKTQYTYKDNLKYNIQLDYTNKVDYKIGEEIEFTDKGCNVKIFNAEDIEFQVSENKQSLILSKKYEPETIFKFNINIECNK